MDSLTCRAVLRILEPITDVFAWKHRGDGSNPQLKRRIIWRPNRPAAVVEADADIEAVRNMKIAPTHLPPSPASAATGRERIPPWTPDQLDTIAIFFTAAKICLVTGCIAPIPQLVELIEPVRTGWCVRARASQRVVRASFMRQGLALDVHPQRAGLLLLRCAADGVCARAAAPRDAAYIHVW